MDIDQPRIGIIGAGIGGASAAYFLQELFPNALMDIYEAGPKVGGRLSTIELNGHLYESGGSVIHDKNKYMVEFRKKFGLKKRKKENSHAILSVYRESDSVFLFKPWRIIGAILNMIRLVWACGIINFIKMSLELKFILRKFKGIYELQGAGKKSFKTVEEMLKAMHILDLTQISLGDYLYQKAGVSKPIVSHLVLPAMRMNYGQGLGVPALVGMVSLAAGMDGSLWAVHGGNSLVAKSLVDHVLKSNPNAALHTSTRVAAIELSPNQDGPRFQLATSTGNWSVGYDILVLAVPLHIDPEPGERIQFQGISPDPYANIPTKYHELWVYVCDGKYYKPNSAKFGPVHDKFSLRRSLFCDAILTTEELSDDVAVCGDVACSNEPAFDVGNRVRSNDSNCSKCLSSSFNSIGFIRPVNFGENALSKKGSAWKIFANAPLTTRYVKEHLLEKLPQAPNTNPSKTEPIRVTKWRAYPEYVDLGPGKVPRRRLPPFLLSADTGRGGTGGGLYHVEAIEWAASAMEMSVIGAKNVALLAHSRWNSRNNTKVENGLNHVTNKKSD